MPWPTHHMTEAFIITLDNINLVLCLHLMSYCVDHTGCQWSSLNTLSGQGQINTDRQSVLSPMITLHM